MFQWPTELDNARKLLSVVGSFWADTYGGNDLVASVLHAKAQNHAQAHLDLLELIACISRFNVPIFHKENWTLITLLESEMNDLNLATFDGTYILDGTLAFDEPIGTPLYVWPAPANMTVAKVIMNQITDATRTDMSGLDFVLARGGLWFRSNPFDDARVRIETVFTNGVAADRAAYLWTYAGEFDWDTVYKQFGYVLGLRLESSLNFRNAVNAIFDGLVQGTSARCLQDFMSAVCDVPLAKATETIQHILTDHEKKWVTTDQNVYGFATNATVLVEVGDVVLPGTALTDSLQFFDFNRGDVPADLRALALGRGTLKAGYFQELVFENTTTELIVTENVAGYTKVEFAIGGWPTDVEKFWTDTHSNGIASGRTLAMCLDQRTGTHDTQPTAIALPATINPLEFLIENVFRGNAFAIVVKPNTFGPDAIGLHVARFLRKLVPPQTLCLLVVQLVHDADTVIMDGPGSETIPGYEEDVLVYLGNAIAETVNPADYITEEVRLYQIRGYCP